MKIAFVTPAYYPAIIGASLYCQTLAEGLVEKGHEVVVHVNAPKQYKKEETVSEVTVKRFPPTHIASYYISRGMLKSLLEEKFDIIHSHHYGYYPATAGFIAAKLKKIPHIFGPYYHPPVYGLKRLAMFSLYHLTQGYPILRFSDKVLPHTNVEELMLRKIGCPKNSMEILPNTVDTNKFKPRGKKEKLVLFVSNLMLEKGADIALGMAEKISNERKDVRFIFVGNIIEKALSSKIDRLSKNKNIRFLRNLSKSSLIRLYQQARVFILPSMYEAFSRAAAEAQACGCVVVATNVGGLREVVRNNDTGFLIDYGDWKNMIYRINYILDNEKQANRMGKNGRSHVIKNFDSHTVCNKLIKIYEKVLR